MLKMVDGTGIIGVDMICPLGVSTPQPPNYDRVELEGTGMLVLPNSLDAPLDRLELGGKTEQVQTTGKNLFDTKTYRDMNGCEIINNNQISFIQNFAKITYETKLDSGDYRISFKRKKYSSFTVRNGESVLNTNGGENDYGHTIKLSEPAVISIEFASGQNPNAEQRYVYDIQLEKGTTATPYEPYTGGKPSPSPEYPQEIKNSGKWNEEKQKYEVDVKVTGKNLLDTYEKAEKDSEFYSVNDDGSLNQLKSDVRPYSDVPSTLFLKSGEYYFSLFNPGVTFKLYNAEADEVLTEIKEPKSILVNLRKDANIKYKVFSNGGSSKNVRVMVSKTKASEYEPYKEQSLTLTSDRPITKWDRLVEQGGQIGWLYNTVEVKNIYEQYAGRFEKGCMMIPVKKNEMEDVSRSAFCDKLKFQSSVSVMQYGYFGVDFGFIYIKSSDFEDAEQGRQWLIDNKPTFLFKSKNTEFVPLPQSEQNAIRALKTYYPTTVITADGGELDPDIKVTYRKEI